ncbi:hypothetical protein FDECE_4307 [Fusarium decemcellulare]|nr:hypothetical protein FDECE_4307 [Fusarium decemcellulare]
MPARLAILGVGRESDCTRKDRDDAQRVEALHTRPFGHGLRTVGTVRRSCARARGVGASSAWACWRLGDFVTGTLSLPVLLAARAPWAVVPDTSYFWSPVRAAPSDSRCRSRPRCTPKGHDASRQTKSSHRITSYTTRDAEFAPGSLNEIMQPFSFRFFFLPDLVSKLKWLVSTLRD